MLAALCSAGLAFGQEPSHKDTSATAGVEGSKGKKNDPAPSTEGTRRKKAPPKVIELEALVIEGRIQKPEVFYVLGRAGSRYTHKERRKIFTHKVLSSVKDNPF